MASRTAVLSKNAPAPSPHLSQAIIHNGTVYCSGQMGVHPTTGQIATSIYDQTTQALKNLDAVAQEAGTKLHNALEVNLFLLSMKDYPEVNRAYIDFFNIDVKPARTCVSAAELPRKGADVEIKAVVALPEKSRL